MNNTTASREVMRLDHTGGLGIGTTSPGVGLAIASSTLANGTSTALLGFRGPYFEATSTTATSTFGGGINITG